MAQRLFSNFESFTHAVLKLPENHCCYLAFSYCLHGLEKKMSFLERKLVLPVPSWKLTLLSSIPEGKVNVSTNLQVRP